MTITPQQAHFELCRRDPQYFRENLIIDGPKGPGRWGDFMAEFQKVDFLAMDPALKFLAGVGPRAPIQRFFQQRGRGSSKTTDLAASSLWLLTFCKRKLDGVVTAEDRDQALLIREQMLKILQYNPWMYDYIDVQRSRIKNKINDATLNSLSRDTASSFGLTPDFTIADEFTHWTQQMFWGSVFSSFNKRQDAGGIIIIACNAGIGADWHWDVRELARTSDLWHFSAPDGHAPWYTDEGIKEQRAALPITEFERLWMNRWQESGGEFVTQAEADACVNYDLVPRTETEQDGWTYVAALDYAEKKDRTVGVVVHQFNDQIIVDRMDVIDPRMLEDRVVRLEWCEQWIRNVQKNFGGTNGSVHFIIDKWQMLYVMQKLIDEGFFIDAFDFQSGTGNWELSLILRQLILHKSVQWYEDCGALLTPSGAIWHPEEGRNDLGSELAQLIIKNISKKWRFDHSPTGHDDRAFALGAACRYIVLNSGGLEGWDITPPATGGQFNFASM